MAEQIINQAQELIEQKQFEEAIGMLSGWFSKLNETEQETIESCKIVELIGQCYYLEKDADNAINYFTQVRILRERKDRADADQLQFTYNYLGLAYKLKNSRQHYKLAIACFEKSIELKRQAALDTTRDLLDLAICYKGNEQIDKGLEILMEAKLQNDNHDNLMQIKILNNIGLCYKEKLLLEQAMETFLQAKHIADFIMDEGSLEINKEFGMLNLNLGNIYFMKKEYGEAKNYYENAKLKAKSKRMLQFIVHKLVLCNQQIGEYDEAIQHCNQDIELIKEVEAKNEKRLVKALITEYTIMSQLYQLQNNLEGAIKYQQMCIELDDSESKKVQMLALYKQGIENGEQQGLQLIAYMENLLKIYESILPVSHPNLIIMLEKIGRAYFDQDNFGEALTKAQQCSQLEPTYKFALFLQGQCQKQLDNKKEAERLLQECIQLDHYYADPYLEMLGIYKEQEKYQETMDLVEQIQKLEPSTYDSSLQKQFLQRIYPVQFEPQFTSPFHSRTLETMEDGNLSKEEKMPIEIIPSPNFVFNEPGTKNKLKFFYNKAKRLLDEQNQQKEQQQQENEEQQRQQIELQNAVQIDQNYSQQVLTEQRGVCAATCKECIIF